MRTVVVGSGIAGLTAALVAAEGGVEVILLTKAAADAGSTAHAQGGIAAVTAASDSPDAHFDDTLTAGAGLNDPAAVRVLVDAGGETIRALLAAGVPFDRDGAGELRRGLEAAHSAPRVLHAGGDATGAAIEAALLARLAASDVVVREHTFLADLVLREGRVTGVDVVDASGRRERIDADAVVLATGGAGQLYAHTTNPSVATGDGIAAAIRAGAAVADLEFVQFHPTAFDGEDPFLVSEAVRGEGAVLRDASGRRFAFDAHPDGELAPRDVVARAIARQSAAQPGIPVVLDATGLGGPEALAARFPTIDRSLRERGIDWSTTPVPVTPAAHYLMGGVLTDLDGRTSVPGLFAVGETARTGVHGANRLASNSLLEGAVFGARAAAALLAEPARAAVLPVAVPPTPAAPASDAPAFSRSALQQLLWDHAGLERDEAGLAHAASVIAAWRRAAPVAQSLPARSVAALEDANLLLVAEHLVAAARRRTVSVGAHFRRDGAPVAAAIAQEAEAC
ncbi:L-aspartate oxidase [Microbacterium neimengense]